MIYAVNKRTKEHRIHTPGYPSSQEEFVEADADGWIEWPGETDGSPVPDISLCRIRLSDGCEIETCEPEEWSWSRGGDQHIIAYRPILGAKPEAPMPEQGTDATTPRRPFLYSGRLRERLGPVEVSPPAWDGEGLPPAGCECEAWDYINGGWHACEVIAHHLGSVALVYVNGDFANGPYDGLPADQFRPIRSAEDRAVTRMQTESQGEVGGPISTSQALRIYHAIRDGKVPGVKLEDT